MVQEILTAAQMGEADRLTIAAGTPQSALMDKAGQGVADAVRALYPGRKILVLCGLGNNGGDGRIAARILQQSGLDVRVWSLADPLPDVKDRVIVDAVFGTGFSRKLEEPFISLFEKIKESGCPVVAVDIPSGIDGSTGAADPHTLKAEVSVTFFRKKLGHVLLPGKDMCGDVQIVDIGISGAVLDKIGFAARENDPALWSHLIPRKEAGDNKYDYGHLLIYGGPRLTGAAQMAAHGALRIGAGLCTIAAHPDAGNVYRRYLPNIMVESCENLSLFKDNFADARRNALLIGPGAGLEDAAALRQAVKDVCASRRPCVLDADALSAFKDHREEFYSLLHENCVLTPHEGEFARVFPGVSGIKTVRAQQAADMTGAIMLLKGADTVIAAKGKTPVVNTNAPATLATGGSGDVLAGMIAGLLAQRVPPFQAACAGAWMHGQAARLFGPGLIAPDIAERIPDVLKGIFECGQK